MTDLVPLYPRQCRRSMSTLPAAACLISEARGRSSSSSSCFIATLHCRICKGQLRELGSKLDEFNKRGVAVVAVSSDTKEQAAQTKEA